MCKFVNNTKHSRIDKCLKSLMNRLNLLFDDLNKYKKSDFKIIACCCGHGKYPLTIMVSHTNKWTTDQEKVYNELISGKQIYRKRNFYKKDKQGYYYIPEVKANKK